MADKKPYVIMATPAYGGMCAISYMLSCQQWASAQAEMGRRWATIYLYNEALIQRARNRLVHDFLAIEDATHLFFVDADIAFRVEDYERMLSSNKDIICGAYPKKTIRWDRVREAAIQGKENLAQHGNEFVVDFIDNKPKFYMNKPFEVEHSGTGFMLIKRKVFDRLAPHVKEYKNSWREDDTEYHKNFFDVQIDTKHQMLLSEDYYFCKLAREHGIKIWCAPWVCLGHMGSYHHVGSFISSDFV